MPFLRQKHDTAEIKRYSPVKLRENMEYYAKQFNEEHKGHTIQYYANGNAENYGVVERASFEQLSEGYWSVCVFITNNEGPFPKKVWLDQIRSCSCIKAPNKKR